MVMMMVAAITVMIPSMVMMIVPDRLNHSQLWLNGLRRSKWSGLSRERRRTNEMRRR